MTKKSIFMSISQASLILEGKEYFVPFPAMKFRLAKALSPSTRKTAPPCFDTAEQG